MTLIESIHFLLPVLSFVVVAVVVARMIKRGYERRRLLRVGIPAPAQVHELHRGNSTLNLGVHRYLEVVIKVEVRPPGSSPYTGQVRAHVSELQIPQVQPGATVQVRIDPNNPDKLVLETPGASPGLSNRNKVVLAIAAAGALGGVGVGLVNSSGLGLSHEPDMSTTCGRAMACCQILAGDTELRDNCRNLSKIGVPEQACEQSLKGFRRAAEAQGLSCD